MSTTLSTTPLLERWAALREAEPNVRARDAAAKLGVSEADVVSTLEAGDLKGKKIGTAWRITRAALDEFLKN